MDLCSPDALVKTIIEFRNSNDMGFMFYAENLKNILNRRNTMFTKLTQKLESFIKLGIPGYDCVVYHKGKCVYRHQNGYSDRENKVVMNGNELYNIYSCSKVITCTAALLLSHDAQFFNGFEENCKINMTPRFNYCFDCILPQLQTDIAGRIINNNVKKMLKCEE